MKKLIAIIGIIMIVACSNTQVVLDQGSTQHEYYVIDYKVTKLETSDIELYVRLMRLNKVKAIYCDTIDTEEYRTKLSELYTKALYKIDTLRKEYE